jgi:hypothetical protein
MRMRMKMKIRMRMKIRIKIKIKIKIMNRRRNYDGSPFFGYSRVELLLIKPMSIRTTF